MKKTLLSFAALFFMTLGVNAQKWTDVTRYYISNPNYENGSTDFWYGSTPNAKSNGVLFFNSQNYVDHYQTANDLTPGKYRLSVQGYYQMGSAALDYKYFTSGNYEQYQHATLEAANHNGTSSVRLCPISSGALTLDEKLAGASVKVGEKYVPSDMNAARNWFNAGYYNNSVEFTVNEKTWMWFQVEKPDMLQNDRICLGKWTLEYLGDLVCMESITFPGKSITLVPKESGYIPYSFSPENTTIQQVTWSSSDPEVASVSDYGTVTAHKTGTCSITATAVDEGGASASYMVEVVPAAIATKDNIIINEIMSANIDVVRDPSGNFGSWIELKSKADKAIDLTGLYVTDDPENLTKAPICNNPNLLSAYNYTVIWFDHYDPTFAPSQIDFKLNYDGGTIYITDGKEILASQEYPAGFGRMTYARFETADSVEWKWSDTPTPRYDNKTQITSGKQVEMPVIAEDGGFFTGKKTVHITLPDDADYGVITYDGTIPREEAYHNGQVIKQKEFQFDLSSSASVRVRAFKKGYMPSNVTTRSFLLKDKNYVFPVIAVTTDMEHLSGYDYGIFTGYGYGYGRPGNGQDYNCNFNADWDRPVNFEYITEKNEYVLNQEVDMSSCGGWSRAWNPKSFKLKAAKYYMGQNTLDYSFFSEKPNQKHKVLQIRNGGNDNVCRIRDAALQKLVRESGLNVNTQAWQPVHVFFNSNYYTVLNMREPNNKHYAYSNYGYDTDNVDQFEMSPDSGYVQKAGTPDKFLELYELTANAADSATYERIQELLDIDEYINYMAVQLYIGNNDWPQNNVKGFRTRDDGKFHFVLFDLDMQGKVSGSPFTTFAGKKNYTFDTLRGNDVTPWKTGDHVRAEIKFVTMFLQLLENETFRRKFTDTFCLVGGSVFGNDYVKEVVNEMSTYMNKGMKLTNESCTSSASSIIGTFTSTYQSSMVDYIRKYTPMQLTGRTAITAYLSSNIDEGELFVNDIRVPTGMFTGKLIKPIRLRATAPAGYRFIGWSRLKTANAEIISSDIEVELTSSTSRYVARWEKMTEEEMIAEGINPAPIIINEVSASNSVYVNDLGKKADWIELYNNSDEAYDIAGMYITDNTDKPEKCQIPVEDPAINTIIPAHGYKLIWCDKKDGVSAIHANFKLEADSSAVMISKLDDEGNIIFADTLNYTAHEGTESYGCYPDGGTKGYLMAKPTPGCANKYCDITESFLASIYTPVVPTAIEDVRMTEDSGIVIAYVGDGIVNVKATEASISGISVFNASGKPVFTKRYGETYTTVNLSELPDGMYIVRATDSEGNSASLKFRR